MIAFENIVWKMLTILLSLNMWQCVKENIYIKQEILTNLIMVTSHGRHGISNHLWLDCLLDSYFRLTTNKH